MSEKKTKTSLQNHYSNEVKIKLEALNALRKRKKFIFRSKLLKHANLIFTLRDDHEASYQAISLYLWRYHRLKVSRNAVWHFYSKITAEVKAVSKANETGFWGEVGE